MKPLHAALLLGIVLASAQSAPAQGIFSKKPKVNPSQRVPELILTLKTDADERKRASAAEELRDYDSATFTEIVPVLADVLFNDKKVSVRLEALSSLARIRPVNQLAGQTLEKAAAGDESWRVRLQAKTALTKYHLAGYSKKSEAIPASVAVKKATTAEPPLAAKQPAPSVSSFPRPLPPGVEKTEPPLQGPALFPK